MTCCIKEKVIRYDEAILFNEYIKNSLLENEFNFYRDVVNFNKFIGTKKEIIKLAQNIYDEYLTEESNKQIYLSIRILDTIKTRLRKKKLINSFLYQDAMIEMSELLERGWNMYKHNFEEELTNMSSVCSI